MIKVGLTGGIGSGKSVVARIFQVKNVPVYVADTESKRLTETSPVIRRALIDLFGNNIYIKNTLNKVLLAQYIFGNKELLDQVNKIIHPVVLTDFKQWANQQSKEIVIIESAILFESGFNKKVDCSLTVYAPEELRIQRVKQRDGFPEEDIRKRMNNQMPEEKKCELSDYIIQNTGEKALIPQVNNFLQFLETK